MTTINEIIKFYMYFDSINRVYWSESNPFSYVTYVSILKIFSIDNSTSRICISGYEKFLPDQIMVSIRLRMLYFTSSMKQHAGLIIYDSYSNSYSIDVNCSMEFIEEIFGKSRIDKWRDSVSSMEEHPSINLTIEQVKGTKESKKNEYLMNLLRDR